MNKHRVRFAASSVAQTVSQCHARSYYVKADEREVHQAHWMPLNRHLCVRVCVQTLKATEHSLPPRQIPLRQRIARKVLRHHPLPIQIRPPARNEINLTQPLQPSPSNQLEHKVNNRKQRQQNIRIHKRARRKRRQRRPALHERQEDIGAESEVGVPGVPERFEG